MWAVYEYLDNSFVGLGLATEVQTFFGIFRDLGGIFRGFDEYFQGFFVYLSPKKLETWKRFVTSDCEGFVCNY